MVDAVGGASSASSLQGLKQAAESQQQAANVLEQAVEVQKAEIQTASTDPNRGQSVNTSA